MILVTGSTGYLGFHICEMLEEKKIPYIAIDNCSKSSIKNIINKNKFFKLNIGSKKLKILFLKYKINTVIHSAAYSFPPEGEKKKKMYYKNNVKKTKDFISLCKNLKVKKFIFFSSSNVYQFKNKISPVNENAKILPQNFYGNNKFQIEKYLKKKFTSCVILRLFNIAGRRNKRIFYEFKNKYRRIFPVISEAAKKRKVFKIYLIRNKNKLIFPARDFVHINDFLEIILKILEKNIKKSITLNVSSNKTFHLDQIIKFFEKKSKNKIFFKCILNENGNLNYTLGNNKKIKKFLNFRFEYNINDIINSYINKKN